MQEIFSLIEKYRMIEPGMRVIAGVSGGADSVCLLYVLKEYRRSVPFEILAVHVEHGIRGKESLEDACFTEALCGQLGVPFCMVRAGVEQMAREKHLSVEEAGRLERYRIFEEICREWGGQRIAVAHNQNDQAETVLWNLARGSGLKGLGGIRPVRDKIIRPLLFTSREKIEELLKGAGLEWRTDRTNLELEYTRNRVRLSVLPRLQRELNSKAPEHIAQAAEKLQQVQDFLESMTEEAAAQCIRQEEGSGDVLIQLPCFHGQKPLIRQGLLRRALELGGGLKDMGSVHVEALMKLAEMDCGKETCLPGGLRAIRENQVLRITKTAQCTRLPASGTGEAVLPVPGDCDLGGWRFHTEILENSPELLQEILQEKKYTKWLSYDTIKGNILLRTRRTGDYLVINSSGGRKKLKDYLIDLKIPRQQRDQMLLLAVGGHILWVPGYRISEAFKVRKETKNVIRIQMKEDIK